MRQRDKSGVGSGERGPNKQATGRAGKQEGRKAGKQASRQASKQREGTMTAPATQLSSRPSNKELQLSGANARCNSTVLGGREEVEHAEVVDIVIAKRHRPEVGGDEGYTRGEGANSGLVRAASADSGELRGAASVGERRAMGSGERWGAASDGEDICEQEIMHSWLRG